MQARDPVDDRQAEAGSSRVGTGPLEARERALQAFDFVFRNARATIEDVDPDLFADARRFQRNRLAAVLSRILQQIDNGSRQGLAVNTDVRQFGKRKRWRLLPSPQRFGDLEGRPGLR